MKNLYYSNFIEKLTDGKNVAFYHKLNGNFKIFSNKNAINILDDIILTKDKTKKVADEVIYNLIDEGFVLSEFQTQEEEWKSYSDYYISINKTIFCKWINGMLELSIPSSNKVNKLKLNKEYGELWIKMSESNIQFKDIDQYFTMFNCLSNYKNCLYKLVNKKDLDSENIFSNLYLDRFYILEENNSKIKPQHLYLKLTDACNLNCKMCGQANNKKLGLISKYNFLDYDAVIKFIEPIIDNIEFVNLWGGEPLLHPRIEEFIEYFAKRKKYVSIATNGTFLIDHSKFLVNIGVDEIVVSLDGPKEIHNEIRRSSTAFDDLSLGISKITNMKNNMQIKPKVILNCTITEENVNYLHEILEFQKDWKVNKLIYQLPMFITDKQGNEYSNICYDLWRIVPTSWRGFVKSYNMDYEELYSFYDNVKKNHGNDVDFYNISFSNKEDLEKYFTDSDNCIGKSKCITLNSTLVIESNGDIVTCPDFPDIKYKNIVDTDFNQYWNSNIRKEFIEVFNKSCYPICKRCCQFV
jgi:MoaA/NifB/PqqE/SkfB family radical SAM enzyme